MTAAIIEMIKAEGMFKDFATSEGPSGKRQITYSCLILLSCLNYKNKEDKEDKEDFFLFLT